MQDKALSFFQRRVIQYVIVFLIIAAASTVFALRYIPAFEAPNFYAEDGKVFLDNALSKNPVAAAATAFNGYLVVGLYIPIEVAIAIYKIFGLHFYQLAELFALLSCLFLGLTVSLPYILLRKQLGVKLAIVAVILGACVAIPTSDYAIIGTIGNLKFVFLYWAFVLTLYRNNHATDTKRVVVTDLFLLLCVLTYGPAIFMLPFAIWPYRKKLIELARSKKRQWKYLLTPYVFSLIVLCVISALYLVVVYVKGIPKIPGYLDTPYEPISTIKLIYRSTLYGWLYPITSTMRDLVVIGILGFTLFIGLRNPKLRYVTIFASWTIFIATFGFVVNRPGISSYFLTYSQNPDQFFYAQTLVFILMTIYLVKPSIDRMKKQVGIILAIGLAIYIWWSVPFGSSFGEHAISYTPLGTAEQNIKLACAQQKTREVTFQIYPVTLWKWTVDRSIACS